ncbi:unnamed protein product, partial [Scytosiphon promiscuus]
GQAGLLGGEAAEGKQHERGQGQLLVTKAVRTSSRTRTRSRLLSATQATSTARAVTV